MTQNEERVLRPHHSTISSEKVSNEHIQGVIAGASKDSGGKASSSKDIQAENIEMDTEDEA